MIFYREWLPLAKKQFAIMAMLADKGKFRGTLSDICDYFGMSRQTKNRDAIKSAINELEASDLISVERKGRSLTIEAIPKDEEIEIHKEWFDAVRLGSSSHKSVSWEAVLKVLLWATDNNYDDVITNSMIVGELGISESTISSAKKVLDEEFGAIIRSRASEKIDDEKFRTIGHHLATSAFWNNN